MPKLRDSLTLRDQNILMFLWRWKLVSSQAIFKKFYPTMSPKSAYNMMTRLKNRKYVRTLLLRTDRPAYAWAITSKGFSVVKDQLPELEKAAYKPATPYHDFLCSALHIGNWLLGAPENGEVFSEQELNTYLPEFSPYWLPKMESHRPDGYWHFKNSETPQTIALEVETSLKGKKRYEKVRAAYEYSSSITHVVWATPTLPNAKMILRQMTREGQLENKKHSFLLLPHVLKTNWDSKFVLGPLAGHSLSKIMETMGMKTRVGSVSSPTHGDLINTRVYAVKTESCKDRSKSKITD